MDIGAEEIIACVSGDDAMQIVKAFGNYTVDLQNIGKWLQEHHVKSVAMESTGVYWIPLFEELERQGFECLLISSRSLRRVPGRKSDIQDAQWIQTLHSYGLLESSFRPQVELVALRTLLRHRSQLLEHRSPHIQHMQKALLQMNVQLSQALSDVTGETGLAIIRAIVAGERDPQKLAALRDRNCKKSAEEIGKALTGTWREEHLFILKQSLAMYDFYTKQVEECDAEIERMYTLTPSRLGRRRIETIAAQEAQLTQQECAQEHEGYSPASEAHQRCGFECGGWLWSLAGTDRDYGSGDGYEQVSK